MEPVRLGVVGLGRGLMLTLPSLLADPRVRLVAGAAPRPVSREAFQAMTGGRTYSAFEDLCADPEVEAIYIATPHQLHADMAIQAAAAGKHVLVDKPLTIQEADGLAMIAACDAANVHLIVGPCHSFDAPVQMAEQIVRSGEFGAVRAIVAMNFTDFMYRPRRPEELQTEAGGGVLFSQGAHQLDIVRLLAGGLVTEVYASTGRWDPERPTESAFQTMLRFASGVTAQCTYSGYAHFDSDVWQDQINEIGMPKSESDYGRARRALSGLDQAAEVAAKRTRTLGATEVPPPAPHHEHFGPILVQLDRADLRITPLGVHVYGDFAAEFRPTPMEISPRSTVISALYDAVRADRPPVQTGRWGLATLAVCHAILESAERRRPVQPCHQVATYLERTE
ncbi:MAG: Gfo/Idh/MocA family protein [Litorivicinaceae bacterium]